MSAVGILKGLRRTDGGTTNVIVTSIPADEFQLGMVLKPIAQGIRRPLRQRINGVAPLRVAQDGA